MCEIKKTMYSPSYHCYIPFINYSLVPAMYDIYVKGLKG